MSEWESLCVCNQAKAYAPGDAPDIDVPGLHLYVVEGSLGPNENTDKTRVYPPQGGTVTLNAVPDPARVGKGRVAAIGGVAMIRTQSHSVYDDNRWFGDKYGYHYRTLGTGETASLPSGTVELRLCNTPNRDVGVFARVEMRARGLSVDALTTYPALTRSSFFTVRNGTKEYYDIVLTYGQLGSGGTEKLLTYEYYPAFSFALSQAPGVEDYRVPFELAVYQPDSSVTPVAVVRDPHTRDGWCYTFSGPDFCVTQGDPFVRAFGQVQLDGSVGVSETYSPKFGTADVHNHYGLADAYMRSIAYNVGESTYQPNAANWIMRPPGMAKAANNVGFTRDAPGFGDESNPLEWPRNFVGDHNRRRLTDGIAGVTADSTPHLVTVVENGASALELNFAGDPPFSDLVGVLPREEIATQEDLPAAETFSEEELGSVYYVTDSNRLFRFTDEYEYEDVTPYDVGLLQGKTFTLQGSSDTQNVFYGSGSNLIISQETAQQLEDVTGLRQLLNGPNDFGFGTEAEALAARDAVLQDIADKKAALDALGPGSTVEQLHQALFESEGELNEPVYELFYTLRAEEWQGEAGTTNTGPVGQTGLDIFDSSAVVPSDHDRFIAAQLDRRQNAFNSGTHGQVPYVRQVQGRTVTCHFSFRIKQYLTSVRYQHPLLEIENLPVFGNANGRWFIFIVGRRYYVKAYEIANAPIVWTAVEHYGRDYNRSAEDYQGRIATTANQAAGEIERVEFIA